MRRSGWLGGSTVTPWSAAPKLAPPLPVLAEDERFSQGFSQDARAYEDARVAGAGAGVPARAPARPLRFKTCVLGGWIALGCVFVCLRRSLTPSLPHHSFTPSAFMTPSTAPC